MSNAVRNIVLATALVAATGLSFAARQTHSPLTNPLAVSALADADRTQAFMGTVRFKITNNSNEIVKVPYWQLPGAHDESKLFQISRDGKPVDYIGKLVKRPAPTEAELVTFQPHETKVVSVDLSKSYDFRAGGSYTVQYGTYLEGARTADGRRLAAANGRMAALQSVPMTLYVDANSPLRSLRPGGENEAKPPSGGTTVVDGVSYVGCTTTRINGAGAAVVSARGYTENAKGYLAGNNQGPRYTTWFGGYTSSRYSTVSQNFVKIDSAMDQGGGAIKINCGCKQNYYAYVYANQPYQIWVCNAFWTAPNTGTDSKAGTLVHEMSHFTVVAGTDDHVYGQSGAKSLAISDPAKAIDNADSHEYFAENTPSQN
jgi:peptidyl-Lys metalloendopeptidase